MRYSNNEITFHRYFSPCICTASNHTPPPAYVRFVVPWSFVTRARMEVVVIVRADMPETAAGANVVVRVPVPRNAVSVSSDVS